MLNPNVEPWIFNRMAYDVTADNAAWLWLGSCLLMFCDFLFCCLFESTHEVINPIVLSNHSPVHLILEVKKMHFPSGAVCLDTLSEMAAVDIDMVDTFATIFSTIASPRLSQDLSRKYQMFKLMLSLNWQQSGWNLNFILKFFRLKCKICMNWSWN